MTVPSAVNKSGPYAGNGVTTSFPYGFRILDASHIQVVRTEGGVDTILTTGFTVTGVGTASGNVVFSVAPTAAQTITLIRNAPFVQQTDLENQGAYYAQTIEDALDLGVMRDQQLQEQIDRSVKLPVGAATFDLDALVGDIVRVADSVNNVDVVAANIADVDAVAANIADVNTVADNIADVTNFADVYQGPKAVPPALRNDGSPLLPGDLYFDTLENRMKVRTSSAWVNAASSVNGLVAQYAYTATAGQTVFAAVYDVGFVNVYLNGAKLLAGDDFTATNGTTVVLTTGATVGDSIEIIGFGAFSTADMLQRSQNGADIPDKAAFRTALSIFGMGSTTTTTITNLNTLAIAGEYFAASGATGSPNAEPILVKMYAADVATRAVQEAFGLTTGRRWMRVETASAWGSWVEVPRAGSVTVADFAAAAVRLSSEGFVSPLDTELATAAWAAAYTNARTPVWVRAAVNFNAIALAGTYSRAGTLVTVTMTAHGMTTGQAALFTVQSGAATNNFTAVVTVIDANTFTYVDGASGTTSGNITRRVWLRGWFNVNRVIYNAAGDYTIEFTTALPNANYVVQGTACGTSLSNISAGMVVVAGNAGAGGADLKTTTQVRIQAGSSASGGPSDNAEVNVMVVI